VVVFRIKQKFNYLDETFRYDEFSVVGLFG
jgi:hypothetical protein